MEITSSYAIELKHIDKQFRFTINIYKEAVSFCIKVFEENWDTLKQYPVQHKERFKHADSLIHSTKSNKAKYPEFDKKFYKLPSYLRRSVVNIALGHLSSYHTNLDNWEAGDKKSKKPTLQIHINKLPTFYKGNMCNESEKKDTILLKLFINNDWNWVEVKLKHTDVLSVQRHMHEKNLPAPTLEKRNKKYFLRFAFTEYIKLNEAKPEDQRICSVDLGINTDAVCSVMHMDGTILKRKFINFPSDKDHLYHTLNMIKKIQQEYGSYNISKLWRQAKFHNDELAKKVARAIVSFAVEQQCDVIVFEHLDTSGRKSGRKKQKLHMWKKNTTQKIVAHKAHQYGIHISHICAWGTSKLAFDGSGEVLRGDDAGLDTYSLCKFQSGKVYNCDLSASYNIGARYFIREIQKSMPEKAWSGIVAKVPECQKRTQCTYSTLLKLNKVI